MARRLYEPKVIAAVFMKAAVMTFVKTLGRLWAVQGRTMATNADNR
jgi:hypothetical protein